MKKSAVYTRTGDKGQTGLVSGNRVSKGDSRIDLYGEVDELNSRIGRLVSELSADEALTGINSFLQMIQSALFDLGSNMACEFENRDKYKLPQLNEELIKQIEHEIDSLDQHLTPLKFFILPGGSIKSSEAHLARTLTRKVERQLIRYWEETGEELPAHSLIFLNRMSDYFFVLARYLNKHDQQEEISWKPRT